MFGDGCIRQCDTELGLLCTKSYCDCLRKPNDEYFWNGASCQQSLEYGAFCMATNCRIPKPPGFYSQPFMYNETRWSSSFMCQELTQGTICNNTKGYFTCECPIFKYFNIDSNACENELTKNKKCKNTNECQTD